MHDCILLGPLVAFWPWQTCCTHLRKCIWVLTGTGNQSVEPEIFPGIHFHLCVGSRSARRGGHYLGNVPFVDKTFSLGKISSRLNEMSVFQYNVSLFNVSGRTQP